MSIKFITVYVQKYSFTFLPLLKAHNVLPRSHSLPQGDCVWKAIAQVRNPCQAISLQEHFKGVHQTVDIGDGEFHK